MNITEIVAANVSIFDANADIIRKAMADPDHFNAEQTKLQEAWKELGDAYKRAFKAKNIRSETEFRLKKQTESAGQS